MSTATLTGKAKSRANATEVRARAIRDAAQRLKQASDPTRLMVLILLGEGEQHVTGLCTELGVGQPALSHHLVLLRHGGLIEPRRDGKHNFYGLTEAGAALAAIVKTLVD